MLFVSLTLFLAQETDNIPYHYVASQCAAQGDGHQSVFFGIDLQTCDDVQRIDRELNVVYRLKIRSLDAKKKVILRRQQRDWINYKNSKCNLSSYGSIGTYNEAECFINEATSRIAQLRRWSLNQTRSPEAYSHFTAMGIMKPFWPALARNTVD